MREYESTPRPEIEYHWHIKDLIDGQQKRVDDRNRFREREKEREERDTVLKDSPVIALIDFYCDTCGVDFKRLAHRHIEVDWSNTTQNIAFYRSKCPRCSKGHWCMRFITDKLKDGYWVRSRNVALDRGRNFKDMVQPWETNFQLLYGRKNT